MPNKDSVSLSANPAKWGGTFTASATTTATSPWLHVEVFQNDTLVWAAYGKGTNYTFTAGPTQAADETQPGSGRVEIGSWARNGSYRATGVVKLEVVP